MIPARGYHLLMDQINGKITWTSSGVIRRIQMIFQDPTASLNERATVDYIISEGLYNHHLFKRNWKKKEKEKFKSFVKWDFGWTLTRYPHEFSGGQRQHQSCSCLGYATWLRDRGWVISALDVSVRAQVLNFAQKFQRIGLRLISLSLTICPVVRFISDRIAVIYQGPRQWKWLKRRIV